LAITAVQNAVKYIGIHFVGMKLFKTVVGMKLFKTVAPGIVKNVTPVGIGESGIVKLATGAPMV
jgi:hypothetical protein